MGLPAGPAAAPVLGPAQSAPAAIPEAPGANLTPGDFHTAVLAVAVPQIKIDEGCRLSAYPDPLTHAEPWTIGYGATGAGIGPDTVWTQAQADTDLQTRCEALCTQLDVSLPWWDTLTPARGAVLVNMAYNLGLAGLLEFKNTLAYVKDGEYAAASQGMLASKWARQVGDRAERLAIAMENG